MEIIELRVLNPATGLMDIILPDVSTFTISPVFSDVGTVQFSYPRHGLNASSIVNDREIGIFFKGVEVAELRSTLEQQEYDDASVAEEGDMIKATCRGNLSRLDRAQVYPDGYPTVNNPPTATFSSATAGYIFRILIQRAQARGTIPYIDISSFSDTHDSNGNTWSTTISIAIQAQTDYLTTLANLVGYGICECAMSIYSLHLYNPGAQGVDRTTTEPPIVHRKGRDLTQSNVQRSTKGMGSVALVAGSNNQYLEVDDSSAIGRIGRRELATSATGVTDPGTLTDLGNQTVAAANQELFGRTNALDFSQATTPMPYQDFDIGDWIYSDLNTGTLERQRVKQWTWSLASDGTLTGSVGLNTLFAEKIAKLNAKVSAIEDGSIILGGSPVTPVEVNDGPPMIPTGLGLSTSAYVDDQGITHAIIDAGWSAVTENWDGSPVTNLGNYCLQWKYHSGSVWSQTMLLGSSTLATAVSPFFPGQEVDFEVGAVDTQGNFSGWSSTVSIFGASDTTPPNEPSTPIVSSQLGQLVIAWDGLDDIGGIMPPDFQQTLIYVSSSGSTFTPSTSNLYSFLTAAGTVQVSSAVLTYGTTYYVRMISLDKTGNASVPSAAGSATLVQIVNTDIATGQVGLNNIAFSDVGNLVDDGSFESSGWRASRTPLLVGTHFSFDNSTASNGAWSLKHTGVGGVGHEQIVLDTIPAKPGQVFMGAADFKSTSAVVGTGTIAYVSVEAYFYDVTNTLLGHQHLTDNWTSPATNTNVWFARVSGSPATAPSNTVTVQFVVTSDNHDAGTIWIDAVEVRMQIDTLLVANAAITNAKIATMQVDKLTAGNLNAGVIIVGSLSTAASGQRCVMDSTGYHAYDSSGNLVFDVNDSSPIITLGRHSGGNSVTIDTSAVWPIMYFNPGGGTNPGFINAIGSGATTGVGVNSGTYSSGFDGSTVSGRCFLTGGTGGVWLQTVNAAQNAHGSSLFLGDTDSNWGMYNNGTKTVGFGFNSTDNCLIGTGRFYNNPYMSVTDAWFTGEEAGMTGFGGNVVTYGPTISAHLMPLSSVLDTTATPLTTGSYISSVVPTSFEIYWKSITVSICSWWAPLFP